MISIHPQYIKDANGKKSLVVLTVEEFDTLLEELEDIEDIKLYDTVSTNVPFPTVEAQNEDTGESILFSDYLKSREKKNG